MKRNSSKFALICLMFLFMFATPTEAKAAWRDIPDGFAYVDTAGCLHHVHTQAYVLFGITFATRIVDDLVSC